METLMNQKTDEAMSAKISEKSGVRVYECYQCGKCTAGCPMAHAMDLMPRQIVRCIQLGMADEVLRSKTIWLCAACHTCVERCPHSIDLPSLIEVARHEAKRQKICAVREVDVFTEAFMGNVAAFGKSQEVILEGLYNTLTLNLFQDMEHVPHMLKHGLIRPELHTVKDRESVHKLMDAAKEEDEK